MMGPLDDPVPGGAAPLPSLPARAGALLLLAVALIRVLGAPGWLSAAVRSVGGVQFGVQPETSVLLSSPPWLKSLVQKNAGGPGSSQQCAVRDLLEPQNDALAATRGCLQHAHSNPSATKVGRSRKML